MKQPGKNVFPAGLSIIIFLDDDYNKLYLAEQHTSTLFRVAVMLAVILACLGLFGLAAFTTVQRTKEIGIRRALGANVSSLLCFPHSANRISTAICRIFRTIIIE